MIAPGAVPTPRDDVRPTLGSLVAAEVRANMARRRITGERVAAELQKSRGYISRRLIGETCLDVDDLQAISDALGVPLESIVMPAIAELRRLQEAAGDRPAEAATAAGANRSNSG